jgi:hypothetical protein
MSTTTKAPALASTCFKEDLYVLALRKLEKVDLELLYDWYMLYASPGFEEQKKLIMIELELRNTLVGKELFE